MTSCLAISAIFRHSVVIFSIVIRTNIWEKRFTLVKNAIIPPPIWPVLKCIWAINTQRKRNSNVNFANSNRSQAVSTIDIAVLFSFNSDWMIVSTRYGKMIVGWVLCGKGLSVLFSASVKRHESSKHAKERIQKCDQCPYSTTLMHSLKRHQERHCKNRARRKFKHECAECTFKTDDRNTFENHNLTEHPKKEILFCNICEFETTEDEELKKHAEIHLKSEPMDN